MQRFVRSGFVLARLFSILLLLPTAVLAGSGDTGNATQPAVTRSAWQRIVLVGASASAGFVETEPLGGPRTDQCRLHRYLEAVLLVPHDPVQNFSSAMLFLKPEELSRDQLARALRTQPTLVVGIDFLFWFCYGRAQSDEERLQRFERGLKLLEEVQCPMVLGDIPDAAAAVNRMLGPEEVPSAEVMSAANRRLREWTATRKNVVLVRLSEMMEVSTSNRALTFHGLTIPAGRTRALLQNDMLHPSPRGCAALAIATVNALKTAQPTHFAGETRLDPVEVFRTVVSPPETVTRTNAASLAGPEK